MLQFEFAICAQVGLGAMGIEEFQVSGFYAKQETEM